MTRIFASFFYFEVKKKFLFFLEKNTANGGQSFCLSPIDECRLSFQVKSKLFLHFLKYKHNAKE